MPQRVLVTAGANGIELAIAQAFAADVPACTSLTSSGFAPEAVSEFVDEVDWVPGPSRT